jgi:hypothetical protein
MNTADIILFGHILFGELGCFAFLWIFVELLNLSESSLKRSRCVACIGTLLIVISWVIGGYYYLSHYAQVIKPAIKTGPYPWAHLIMMETKEHVFLFLPFLAFSLYFLLKNASIEGLEASKNKVYVMALSAFIFILGMSMAFYGFLISTGYRMASGGGA